MSYWIRLKLDLNKAIYDKYLNMLHNNKDHQVQMHTIIRIFMNSTVTYDNGLEAVFNRQLTIIEILIYSYSNFYCLHNPRKYDKLGTGYYRKFNFQHDISS